MRKTQGGTDSCTAKPRRPYITIFSRLYDESAKPVAYIDVGLNLGKVKECIAKAQYRFKDNVR